MASWSSLPADLVNRIADLLLATDDLDCYMDLRAVCRGWRCSTADPKNMPRDPRFRPRQWAMLDEVHQSDARLFVNVATGRFVRRDLPLLRRYDVVAGAAGGLVVLAERTAPYTARILNPFTGAMISFVAPVPCLYDPAAHVIGSLPTLVFISKDDSPTIYWADPDSKMESAEEMLVVVFERLHGVDVFKINTRSCLLERVKNLGSRAIFVGEHRCLAVDADKFASVEANCIYYVMDEPWYDVCVYRLKDETGVRAGGAIDSFSSSFLCDDTPFSDVQLLCYYTFEVRKMFPHLQLNCFFSQT
ncbi:hypothetical protein ZEAMMB73_Zm00001d021115 [Zea mays]|uniref:KIB1-4 beta-propeller domain-containing protein n=1 Tax=Zea mays TaxID=4577 RepID=A0A1D6I8C5_MAIZE|nr:hypothetical protein ZEAMMB73_Zm00001d021115 [Zea mays]